MPRQAPRIKGTTSIPRIHTPRTPREHGPTAVSWLARLHPELGAILQGFQHQTSQNSIIRTFFLFPLSKPARPQQTPLAPWQLRTGAAAPARAPRWLLTSHPSARPLSQSGTSETEAPCPRRGQVTFSRTPSMARGHTARGGQHHEKHEHENPAAVGPGSQLCTHPQPYRTPHSSGMERRQKEQPRRKKKLGTKPCHYCTAPSLPPLMLGRRAAPQEVRPGQAKEPSCPTPNTSQGDTHERTLMFGAQELQAGERGRTRGWGSSEEARAEPRPRCMFSDYKISVFLFKVLSVNIPHYKSSTTVSTGCQY